MSWPPPPSARVILGSPWPEPTRHAVAIISNNHYIQFMTERTGGQLLVDALAHQSVRTIFGIPGVQLDHAADALYQAAEYQAADRISFFCARNEQATTYMADGYARSTGTPGVAMV